ncbi:hypothetical protein [Legionella sp. WA2024007413]
MSHYFGLVAKEDDLLNVRVNSFELVLHPGVVNTCRHAIKLTALNKIYLVMGGFHLAGPTFEPRIDPTVADLSSLNPDYVITGHCTGSQAQSAFTETFKDRHIPYSVATVFNFSC